MYIGILPKLIYSIYVIYLYQNFRFFHQFIGQEIILKHAKKKSINTYKIDWKKYIKVDLPKLNGYAQLSHCTDDVISVVFFQTSKITQSLNLVFKRSGFVVSTL